jgi:DNA-binding NarL/FixJ family response regulator
MTKLTKEAVEACCAAGMSMAEAARHLGVAVSTVRLSRHNAGLSWANGNNTASDAINRRAEEMVRLYRSGWTQKKIATALGVTEHTVWRTLNTRCGLGRYDGGQAVILPLGWSSLASIDDGA